MHTYIGPSMYEDHGFNISNYTTQGYFVRPHTAAKEYKRMIDPQIKPMRMQCKMVLFEGSLLHNYYSLEYFKS